MWNELSRSLHSTASETYESSTSLVHCLPPPRHRTVLCRKHCLSTLLIKTSERSPLDFAVRSTFIDEWYYPKCYLSFSPRHSYRSTDVWKNNNWKLSLEISTRSLLDNHMSCFVYHPSKEPRSAFDGEQHSISNQYPVRWSKQLWLSIAYGCLVNVKNRWRLIQDI